MTDKPKLSQHDIDVLHRLAARKAEIARDPVNLERKEMWYRHDSGDGGRPMILAEWFGVGDENRPIPFSVIECEDPWAQGLEWGLRTDIYQFEELRDDHVVEPFVHTNWKMSSTDYGVQSVHHTGDNEGRMGSQRWDHPVKDLDTDFDKLHPRSFSVDREATFAEVARLESVFDGILPVRLRGMVWWTMGMTMTAIDLIGLENLMLYMFDNPDGLHRVMAFLRDDHLAWMKWMEEEGLLTLNNENDYIGSGSMGYSRDLPQPGLEEGQPARVKDMWGLSESQETVGVGPDQFEEFIFPYQLATIEPFGKCYYGCCEPVNSRWHILKRIPNLARVSVSPWADEEFMAAELGTRYAYSRKPAPSMISTAIFDENAIREDLRHTLSVARGCRVELIMKDVHTLNNEPGRLPRWVQIAREVIDEQSG